MNRDTLLQQAQARTSPWDLIIVGGGATGAGVAVDAATRGYAVLLLERSDFGHGTSSRSTKLVHGGVRYLEQGNVALVMEALHERGMLRQNAPHLVRELPFIVPSYAWWEGPFYGVGLKMYQLLSGKYGFGASRLVSKEQTLERLPNVNPEGLKGGVIYYDGQFDDSRLLINLVTTAQEQGATLLNYARVSGLSRGPEGLVNGVEWEDVETGRKYQAAARVVINATGPFTDGVRKLADPKVSPMISPSQGVHLVFDRSFLPGDTAIMVPHTSDGRVMFAIPWHGHTLVGTTDTPLDSVPEEPKPLSREIDFILETSALYLAKKPGRADILSAFAGIRPLAKVGDGKNTAALSRDHVIHIDQCGLLNIAGGKWTTYRNMAQDCVNHAATLGDLPEKECVTRTLNIHGHHPNAANFGELWFYGTDAPAIRQLAAEDPALATPLDPALPTIGAEVVWAARHEMARSVEDVLARRTRSLFLNANAAVRMAPATAALLARELGRDAAWSRNQVAAFTELARNFQVEA
ncbi:MAG TPA: glycerol-3-phosphate dehydrogenase/oxidase [Verrucomicrobiota bacterium]|nr:glycerol-3-phosphate dehydrogenase/oxidase [Verrucomicrobiota bacterium]